MKKLLLRTSSGLCLFISSERNSHVRHAFTTDLKAITQFAKVHKMDSLFPQQRPGETGMRQSEAIISFKAGKCILSQRQSNGKFTVTPDKRRGTLSLSKSSDGLMNLRWSDRSTGILEDHRSIVPGEVTFKKCRTGRESDRVYLLQFTQAQQPLMFWMQEKSSEKDLDNASKINEYANNPAAADAAVAGTC